MLKQITMGLGAAALLIAISGPMANAADDGSLDLGLGDNGVVKEGSDGGLDLNLSKDSFSDLKNRFKLDRSKPLRIHIPGIININHEFSKDEKPSCEELYKDMVKSGTDEAKNLYHKECIDD